MVWHGRRHTGLSDADDLLWTCNDNCGTLAVRQMEDKVGTLSGQCVFCIYDHGIYRGDLDHTVWLGTPMCIEKGNIKDAYMP